MFDNEIKYILNTRYRLLNDKNRILILSGTDNGIQFTFLHPVQAILLSYFTGEKTFGQVVIEVENDLGIVRRDLEHFMASFIENKQRMLKYDNFYYKIPPRVLVKNRKNEVRKDMDRALFLIQPPYDFSTIRLNVPRSMLFVINTICRTDCIYCYADRKTVYRPLPVARILQIIEEAKAIGMTAFDISGGELFLHKDWEVILEKAIACGFDPFVSTKIPLSGKTIDRLKQIGGKKLQVSLDTLDEHLQTNNLKCAKSYVSNMKKCITELIDKGIEVHIKSTLTRYTCTPDNVSQLLDFINPMNGIKSFSLTAISYSRYMPPGRFEAIRPTLAQLRRAQDCIREQKRKNLLVEWDFRDVHYANEYANKAEFDKRDNCTGNIAGFVLLPDGKVTICEGLYWDANFIIGDLSRNSIMQMWNSPEALSLFGLRKENISQGSPCIQCGELDKCRSGLGVCWKDITAYYGDDKWDYPDPRCPNAYIIKESVKMLSYEEV